MGRMHEQWVPGSPFLPCVNLIEPEHEANMHYAAHYISMCTQFTTVSAADDGKWSETFYNYL